MLNSSPEAVKSSVGEANDVFSSLLNTHKYLVEGGMVIQKGLDSHSVFRKAALRQRSRSASLYDTPITKSNGEKRVGILVCKSNYGVGEVRETDAGFV